ncbi:hypothetical protein C8N40_11176 [Pontibacter mucosus]|uniref:Uncharacterized protein n=1 Tax=Pontibacter mucosus TaxID=1649266 RepID=A0A2T5YD10_9BACT|nr:hypothetical protein [Pontibacter mucosus]PTX14411.1 hypothetical protein C8N40_11176 [Pontibacter mucosus]
MTQTAKPNPRYKEQTARDLLEQRKREPQIRMMYAAKLAGMPNEKREEKIPREFIGKAFTADYEVVISALIS